MEVTISVLHTAVLEVMVIITKLPRLLVDTRNTHAHTMVLNWKPISTKAKGRDKRDEKEPKTFYPGNISVSSSQI